MIGYLTCRFFRSALVFQCGWARVELVRRCGCLWGNGRGGNNWDRCSFLIFGWGGPRCGP